MNRTALGAAWVASMVTAGTLGFTAVWLLDEPAPLGVLPASSPGGADRTGSPDDDLAPSAAAPAEGTGAIPHTTAGGVVYARCVDGSPVLAAAPAPGWWLDTPSSAGEVAFEDGRRKVELVVSCDATGPRFTVEGPRAADDRGRGRGSDDVHEDDNGGDRPRGDDSNDDSGNEAGDDSGGDRARQGDDGEDRAEDSAADVADDAADEREDAAEDAADEREDAADDAADEREDAADDREVRTDRREDDRKGGRDD